jgi:hypothetical protein
LCSPQQIGNRPKLGRFLVSYLDTERRLNSHNDLNDINRIEAKVCGQIERWFDCTRQSPSRFASD